MSLLGLPSELLDNIIALTWGFPAGFENTLLTCKSIYQVGKHHLPRYHALRRKWKNVSLDGNDREIRSSQNVLRAIAQDPIIAGLIETLDLRGGEDSKMVDDPDENEDEDEDEEEEEGDGEDEDEQDDEDEDEDEVEPQIQYQGSVIKTSKNPPDKVDLMLHQMVRQSLPLAMAGQDADAWIFQMRSDAIPFVEYDGNYDYDEDESKMWRLYRAVFLLTLLPNLIELTLPEDWSRIDDQPKAAPLEKVLNTTMRDLHTSPDKRNMPLSKLRRLLPFEEIEYDPSPRGGVRVVSPFMVLPTLEELHVTDLIAVDDGYTGIPFTWDYPDLTSNLRMIYLEGCCVSAEGVAELLTYTPHVTSFHYSHGPKWHGVCHDWDAGGFVAAVGMRGEAMTDLTIKLDHLYGEVETGVISLKQFPVLERLKIDVRAFCAPSPDSGEKFGLEGTKSKIWTADCIPPLQNILPSSVKYVSLYSGGTETTLDLPALRALFKNPEALNRSSALSNLEVLAISRMTFDADLIRDEELREALTAAGADVLRQEPPPP